MDMKIGEKMVRFCKNGPVLWDTPLISSPLLGKRLAKRGFGYVLDSMATVGCIGVERITC